MIWIGEQPQLRFNLLYSAGVVCIDFEQELGAAAADSEINRQARGLLSGLGSAAIIRNRHPCDVIFDLHPLSMRQHLGSFNRCGKFRDVPTI